MKPLLSLALAAVLSLSAAAQNYPLTRSWSKQQVAFSLLPPASWVPFPAYSDRQAWDSLTGPLRPQLIKRGEKRLTYQWKHVLATDYLEYDRSGNRQIMEAPMTANHNAFSDLLLAELAEGKGRFVDQLLNGLMLECERTTWVLSAHQFRQPTGRTLPDARHQIIDLGSGEIGGMLAWTYYFLHDRLDSIDPSISIRLRDELRRRIVDPYLANDREWWMSFYIKPGGTINNWNPWCNFNVLQTALLVEDDSQKLQNVVWRSMQSVDLFINHTHSDGACEEGPSYWGHAAGKLLDYLDLLYRATGGMVNLFDNAQIRAMGEYIVNTQAGQGWVVNFADASARFSDNISPLIYRYGRATRSDALIGFAATLAAERAWTVSGGTDVWRSLMAVSVDREMRAASARMIQPACVVYPETQFFYFRTDSNMLAVKGGHNHESHNHNDVGSCIYFSRQSPVLVDVGVGTYTAQTFGPDRYSIWTMQSQYHNLPTINGQMQQHGANYRAGTVSVDTLSASGSRSVSIDIALAYPAQAGLRSWVRTCSLLRSGGLSIQDSFAFGSKPKEANVLNFMLRGSVDVSTPGRVIIHTDGQQHILTYDSRLFTAHTDLIPLDDPKLTRVWGNQLTRLRLVARKIQKEGNYLITLQ